jgi:tetratricopeptide (TPR) repeat protein/CHAT domain-containing protein
MESTSQSALWLLLRDAALGHLPLESLWSELARRIAEKDGPAGVQDGECEQFPADAADGLSRLCLQDAEVLGESRRFNEVIALCSAAEPILRRLGRLRDVAACRLRCAAALDCMGRHEEAVAGYSQAEREFREAGMPEQAAHCCMNRAKCLTALTMHAEAAAAIDAAAAMYSEAEWTENVANARLECAIALFRAEQWEQAISAFMLARPLCEDLGQNVQVMICHFNLANLLFRLKRYEAAIASYEAAQAALLAVGQRHSANYATCAFFRARSLVSLERHLESIEALIEAETECEQAQEALKVAQCRWYRARALGHLRRDPEAIACYEAAEVQYAGIGEFASAAQCRKHRAQLCEDTGQPARAAEHYGAAVEMFSRAGRRESAAHCQLDRAGALHALGRCGEALAALDEAEPVLAEFKQGRQVGQCKYWRAIVFYVQGRCADAIIEHNAAEIIFRATPSQLDLARCIQQRALCRVAQGRADDAVVDARVAREMFQDLGDADGVASCDSALDLVKLQRSLYSESLAGLDPMVLSVRATLSPEERANWGLNRAITLMSIGRYAEAIALSEEARSIFESIGAIHFAARCRRTCATAYITLGRHAEALAELDMVAEVAEQLDLPDLLAICRMDQATVLSDLGHRDDALERYKFSETIFEKIGRRDQLAICWMARSTLCVSSGQLSLAIHLADAAAKLGNDDIVARCALVRAVAHQMLGEPEKAVENLDAAEPEFIRSGRVGHVADCRLRRILVLSRAGRSAEAVGLLPAARQAWRSYRATLGHDGSGVEGMTNVSSLPWIAFEALGTCGQWARAWSFAQEGKAAMLGDWLVNNLALSGRSGEVLPDELSAQRDDIKNWLLSGRRGALCGSSEGRAAADAAASRSSEFDVALQSLKMGRSYVERFTKVRSERAGEANEGINQDMPLIEGAQVASQLPDDVALIDWCLDDDLPVVFVLRKRWHEPKVVPLNLAGDAVQSIMGELDRWRDHLTGDRHRFRPVTRTDVATAHDTLRSLWDLLFRPISDHADNLLEGAARLYLIPHAWTHLVPLHAMMDRAQSDRTLDDIYEILYLPGASLLAATDAGGTPILKSWRHPGPDRIRMLSLINPERGTSNTLPFSEWEGYLAKKRLGIPPERLAIFKGREEGDPSRAGFEAATAWGGRHIVHYSCHGSGEPQFSLVAHLRLAGDVLLAHDVLYRCRDVEPGALIVLNGCETYEKDYRAVDEGLGLASMFLAKGAGLVLGTMWSVADYAGAAIVTKFLEGVVGGEIGRGAAPTQALREAIRALRSTGWGEAAEASRCCRELFAPGTLEADTAERVADRFYAAARGNDTGPEDASEAFSLQIQQLENRPERPFEHPVWWAAYQFVGRFE